MFTLSYSYWAWCYHEISTLQVSLISVPLSLFICGFIFCICSASRTFLSHFFFAWSMTWTLSQSISCISFWQWTCSATADFAMWRSRIASRCSLQRTLTALRVSNTYSSSHVLHLIAYTACVTFSTGSWSLAEYNVLVVLGVEKYTLHLLFSWSFWSLG